MNQTHAAVAEPSISAGGDADGKPSLRARALRGSFWTTLGYGGSRLLRLAGNLVLTRLLFPEAFGLMALVNVFLMGLAMFSDFGITAHIVQSRRGDEPAFLDTAWTLQILRGLLLGVLAAGVAFPVAAFYGQAELVELLPVAALSVVLGGFESTSLPRLRRHLLLGRLTLLEFGTQAVSLVVMACWALLWPSVWALVVGGVTASLARMGASHLLLRDHRDRLAWDAEAGRELLHFGKWVFVSTMMLFLAGQLDRLVFGKVVSLATLGVYSIAFMLATLPGELINQLSASVVFPLLSRQARAPAGLAALHRRARLPLLALGGLATSVLVAGGGPLVEILYDSRYAAAGWMLQILAVAGWFQILALPAGTALLALGLPRWLALASAAKVVAILCFIPAGFHLAGLAGAIVGFGLAEGARYLVLLRGAGVEGLRTLGSDLAASLGLGLAALAGFGVEGALEWVGAGSLARLAAASAASGLLWLGVAYGMLRSEGEGLRALLRPASP